MCINRERVNVAGRVNMICFDKTGTLTEDFLDIHGYRPVTLNRGVMEFNQFTENCEKMAESSSKYYKEKIKNQGISSKNKDLDLIYVECLSSCHGITSVDGKLIGDPIDVKMFEACGWILKENSTDTDNYGSLVSAYIRPADEQDLQEKLSKRPSDNNSDEEIFNSHYELGIVRRFDFSSKLQRMSVIVKNAREDYFKAYCKGSPEKIKELCQQDTVPSNFNDILSKYTMKGFRVLALCFKNFKMDYMYTQKVDRDVIESNMIFLGLLIVQNKLKEKTKPSIETLQKAGLKMVMATGDNILTAISVSRDCSLINNETPIFICDIVKGENNESELVWSQLENFSGNQEQLEELRGRTNSLTRRTINNLRSSGEKPFSRTQTRDSTNPSLMRTSTNPNPMRDSTDPMNTSLFAKKFAPETIEDKSNLLSTINENETEFNLKMGTELEVEVRGLEEEAINIDVSKYPMNYKQNESTSLEETFTIAITGPNFESLWKMKNKFLSTKNPDYRVHFETFKLVLQNGYIFARMSPEHKGLLVESLREQNLTVCMCGDGANDCSALRAADVGVSLSREEASIAAHFTSSDPDISCLIKLFREGKASLVTSIQTFKYMMIYSLIQFISVTLLMTVNSYLSDNEFLVPDLLIIFPLAILIARTGAYYKLTHHQPTGALISLPIISSILLQCTCQLLAQFFGWYILSIQEWYVADCTSGEDTVGACDANTVRHTK